MTLVLSRITAARTLVVAAVLAALVTTVLLTAFLQYAQLLPTAGIRAAVGSAPAAERTLHLSAGSGRTAEEMAERDRYARELLAPGVAGIPLEVYGGGYAISQELPDHGGESAVVVLLPDLADHADLVDGAWPESAAEPVEVDVDPDGAEHAVPVQVAMSDQVARQLGLAVGDDLTIHDGRESLDRPATLVGVWQPREPDSAYWRIAGTRVDAGGTGPLVVHPDVFTAHFQSLGTLEWVAVPDPGALAEVGMEEVLAGFDELAAALAQLRADADIRSLRLNTEMDAMAARLYTAAVVNRSGLVLPAALLSVIAGYALVLLARLLAAHRRAENALLRARGASRNQLFRLTATEAVLVATPAAVLGAPVGTWLVAYADQHAGDRSLGLAADLAGHGWVGPSTAWLIALAAAGCCALALAASSAGRGRTWVAEQQQQSRPRQPLRHLRGGLDLALVLVAVIAWTQLRQYDTTVLFGGPGGAGIDPLLVAAPVVAVLAGTAVAMRLLPLATRLAVRLAEEGRRFAGLLGMWQADRRPHAGPVLLLVLAVATAVLAPAVAATWQQSQRDQAAHAVGADLRLTGGVGTAGDEVADLPGVTGVVPVHRSRLELPEGGLADLVALDTARAAGVVQLRGAVADGAERMFGPLANARPPVSGHPLPAGAQRLTGQVRFTFAEPVTVTGSTNFFGQHYEYEEVANSPTSGTLVAHFADDRGLLRSLELGDIDDDGVLDLDLRLPPGAATLVALGGQLRAAHLPPLCPPGAFCPDSWLGIDLDPMTVAWEWDLHLSGADGSATALSLPPDWQVRPSVTVRRAPELTRSGDTVEATVEPARQDGMLVPFLVGADLPEVNTLRVVVTPEVLAATGGEVGRTATIANRRLQLVDTVPAVPGTERRAAVMVDLGTLSLQAMTSHGRPLAWREWWVASDDPAATAAAAETLGLAVRQRAVEEQRLLDDPLGTGVLLALWAAALGAALLAAFGLTVDSRATAVGRQRELAVLHTLGTPPRWLARSLVTEQALLAGLGVAVGGAVGVVVAATMGPSLVLTEAGEVPIPTPELSLSAAQVVAPVAGLFVLALVLGAVVARRARRELAVGGLRIGAD